MVSPLTWRWGRGLGNHGKPRGNHAEVEMVGSDKWMTQHDTLTRLNLQAHHNVAAMSDEFVKEAFISFDRLDCLVHELLVVEAWKDHVFPTLGTC